MIQLHKQDLLAESHFITNKDFIKDRIKNILKAGHIKKGAKKSKKIKVSKVLDTYLKKLLDDRYLKIFITLPPEKFETLITNINKKYSNLLDKSSNCYKIIYNIFVSTVYETKFNKLEFVNLINIDTCPYCNRGYIYSLDKADEIKPQIDHFYPKSLYPFLAMSFYNLIPSCQTCNGFGAKEEKDPLQVNLINPYLLDNTHFRFGYRINTFEKLNPLVKSTNFDKNNLTITLKTTLSGHLSVFKLDKLYEKHSDHVLELIIRSKLEYGEDFRAFIKQKMDFKFSDFEVDRMIINNYSLESEIHKRPLAKFYQDISEDLGLITRNK